MLTRTQSAGPTVLFAGIAPQCRHGSSRKPFRLRAMRLRMAGANDRDADRQVLRGPASLDQPASLGFNTGDIATAGVSWARPSSGPGYGGILVHVPDRAAACLSPAGAVPALAAF